MVRTQLLAIMAGLIIVSMVTFFVGTKVALLTIAYHDDGPMKTTQKSSNSNNPSLVFRPHRSGNPALQAGATYSARTCLLVPGWGIRPGESWNETDGPTCVGRQPNFANSSSPQLTCDNEKPNLPSAPIYHAPKNNISLSTPEEENAQVTIALLYFAKPALLFRQLEEFKNYSLQVRKQLTLLVVDDGSPPGLRASDYLNDTHRLAHLPMTIRVVRITTERDWNIGGARNLAFYLADTPRTLLLDLDVLVPKETMEAALTWPMYDTRSFSSKDAATLSVTTSTRRIQFAHRFNRRRPDGSVNKHPAITMLQTRAYWENGGCDEDFCGSYGFTDVHFWHRWKLDPNHFLWDHLDVHLEEYEMPGCHPDYIDPNLLAGCKATRANTTKPGRELKKNHALFKQKIRKGCWSNRYLRFRWTIEYW